MDYVWPKSELLYPVHHSCVSLSVSTNKMFRFPNGIILASVASMDS
jgi:hypothetical protein